MGDALNIDVPKEMKTLAKTMIMKRISFIESLSNHGLEDRTVRDRLVTNASEIAHRARVTNPEIRTLQPKPIRVNSCRNIMGYRTPPIILRHQ